jgi:enoyl-CoA hydratase/carnithine racemase|tara:strand:+ start:1098 stop:1970 length:873 start_codon:yes stop_codon:yes gene_type:complete
VDPGNEIDQEMKAMIEIDTGTEELLCRIQDRVGVITLNKPHKKNALGDILTPALRRTVVTLEEDDRVGCVMITGAGDAFCSGGDVSGMGGGGSRSEKPSQPVKSKKDLIAELTHKQVTLTLRIHELAKVTIAALPGAAAGAGLSIALACDLRVASSKAFVTTAFRNIGLSGDYGGSWFLPRLIGLAKAKELYYTADRVDAEEGARLGIFNKVFPEDTFREDALAYAARIANGPTNALGRMKINLNRGINQSLRESLVLEAQHLIGSAGNNESKEAISAFMEKRMPEFHKG